MNYEFDSKKLIDKYSDKIYLMALKHLKNIEDAEDIVQNVFIKYIDYIKSGRVFKDESHEYRWIAKVTKNMCYNELNSARKRKNIPLIQIFTTEDNNVLLNTDLFFAIDKLKEKYKIVLELHYLYDLRISDIARILNISEDNVKTRLKRGRDTIKSYILNSN